MGDWVFIMQEIKKVLTGFGAMLMGICLSAHSYAQNTGIPAAINNGKEWRVIKDRWAPSDERGFEAFVQAIGRAQCSSLDSCLENEVNPYRETDERIYIGDCADMVYVLRAYYAWKNGLPFSHQSAMQIIGGKGSDTRFSEEGNRIVGRRDAIGARPINAPNYVGAIRNIVSTAMFRTHPDGGKNKGGGRLYDDFYPVKISREAIRPGTVAYDIYGHVGLVYDVTQDGRVLIVASHPDNSVTRTVYDHAFLRAKPALGAGLKSWRPVVLKGARKNTDGTFSGGRIHGIPNDELEQYSLEQFYGTNPHPNGDWRYGDFIFGDTTLSYYDYIRRRLASPDFAYNPVDELRLGMRNICNMIYDRRVTVQRAVSTGITKKPHPKRLPPNIYGTHGSWEDFSSPSRDARLKVAFIELRRSMERYVSKIRAGSPTVTYEGDNLEQDLWETYKQEEKKCRFFYTRSDDTRVRLNMGHVMERLFDLSFDPYHCPELRWGARGIELESCPDDTVKRRWYDAQRYMRNQARRTYDVRMDFTLEEIKPPTIASPEEGGLGVEAPADADVRGFLARLAGVDQPRGAYSP